MAHKGKRRGASAHRSMGASRRYPRTARLNELIQQIVATELQGIDDERLELVTVMAVEVEPEMHWAKVFVDRLGGADGDEGMLEALEEHRQRLQQAVNRQTRLKRTPVLEFHPDSVGRYAAQVEGVLAGLEIRDDVEVPDEGSRAAVEADLAEVHGLPRPGAEDDLDDFDDDQD